MIGLALGIGVKRNVINLYKFLCHNHQDGDRIWAFGFSRGAFTVRVLAGLIDSQGLVTFDTEAELQQNAIAAYRAYRKVAFKTKIPWVWLGRRFRDGAISLWRFLTGGRQYTDTHNRRVRIYFIGVWDTVAAYGLPVDELTIAVDKWVWPMKFDKTDLPTSVDHARHACGLDDERRTFHPIPWNENHEKKIQAEQAKKKNRTFPPNRLLQVWFPGMHADVGGGYPDDGLSLVPLCWMIDEAADKGLKFEPIIVATYRATASPTGRLYDSRSGFGTLWRYQPRNVQFLMDNNQYNVQEAEMVTPLVHHSAVTRMTYGNDGYAPISLPLNIDILLPDESRVPLPDKSRVPFDMAAVNDALKEIQVKITQLAPARDPVLEHTATVLIDLKALTDASASVPREDYLALVLDTVWWRRVVYFVTLGLALAALAFPLVYEYLDLGNNIEKAKDLLGQSFLNEVDASDSVNIQTMANGLLTWVAGLVDGFLPGYASPWVDAVTRNALGAVGVVLLFLGSLALSTLLQGRIHDRSRAAWAIRQKIGGPNVQRLQLTGQRHALFTLTVIFAVLAFFVFFLPPSSSHLFGPIAVLAAIFAAWWIFRLIKPAGAVDPSRPPWLLKFANTLRTNPWSLGIYRWAAQTAVPILFILAVAYLALSGLNLTLFNIQSTKGAFCIPSSPKKDVTTKEKIALAAQKEGLDHSPTIDLKSLCNPTGIQLVAGRQYRIRIETEQDWFDKSIPADVGGLSSGGLRHALSATLRRWWREKWFQPIARVGSIGNYEYPLRGAAPLTKTDFTPCAPPTPSFGTALGQTVTALAETILHPITIAEAIQEPASRQTMDKEIACERDKGIGRAKLLISDITPDATGELFIYVNDAILFWPGLQDLFYKNNTGTAKVTVTRTIAPATIDANQETGQPAQKN